MTRTPTKRQKARTSAATTTAAGAGPQFKVGCVLLAAGPEGMNRLDLGARCDVSSAAISQALWYMRKVGRVDTVGDTSRLTPAGRDWVNGGANLANQHAIVPSPTSVKRLRRDGQQNVTSLPLGDQRRLGVVQAPAQPVAKPSFRCAVISDGGFFLEKNGVRIDLEADEHRHMLRYLDRMTETAAA